MSFNDSSTAIETCRDLCAEYGFTVKQEASTHRVSAHILLSNNKKLTTISSRISTFTALVKVLLIHFVTPNPTLNVDDRPSDATVAGALFYLKPMVTGNSGNLSTQKPANTTIH
jgi:hypothetical protein